MITASSSTAWIATWRFAWCSVRIVSTSASNSGCISPPENVIAILVAPILTQRVFSTPVLQASGESITVGRGINLPSVVRPEYNASLSAELSRPASVTEVTPAPTS